MQKVEGVFKQIVSILKEMKIEVKTSEDKSLIIKAICSGYFSNAV